MEIEKNNKDKILSLTRRAFLKLGLSISAAASTWGIFKFLSYESPEELLLSFIVVGQPQKYPRNSSTYIREVKAWLIHDDNGFYAISAICTHLGCTINHKEKIFDCPCHGSQFDLSGQVIQGPATIALPGYEVRLSEDGNLIIDRRITVPSSKRFVV